MVVEAACHSTPKRRAPISSDYRERANRRMIREIDPRPAPMPSRKKGPQKATPNRFQSRSKKDHTERLATPPVKKPEPGITKPPPTQFQSVTSKQDHRKKSPKSHIARPGRDTQNEDDARHRKRRPKQRQQKAAALRPRLEPHALALRPRGEVYLPRVSI